MHSTLEKLENNRVSLKIEVPAADFEKAIAYGFKKVAQQVNIPGFRKGKAPRSVVERFVGSEPAYKEALDKLVPEAYGKAVSETGIKPIDHPEVEIEAVEAGKPLVFTATVQVLPEVTLGQYKNFEIEPKEYTTNEEDYERELAAIKKRFSTLEDTDRDTVEKGDVVTIDLVGKVDGEEFEGGTAEDFVLEIGSGQLIPGFEDQLVGVKLSEPAVVNVTFPEDYFNTELAGKEAAFDVVVKTIKVRVMPELDEELVKKLGNFDSVEAFNEDLRKRILDAAEARAVSQFEDEVLTKVVDNAAVDVPDVLVNRRIDALVQDFARQLSYQRITLEEYLNDAEMSGEELREKLRPRAEREVKTDLVLDVITKVEGIEATDEDVDDKIQEMAARYGVPDERVRSSFNTEETMANLKERIAREKTVAALLEDYDKKAVKAE